MSNSSSTADTTGPKITGSCACGRLRFSTTAKPRATCWCYCTTCRKCAGAPYIPFVHFPRDQIMWEGETQPDEWRKSLLAIRMHCKTCSSVVGMVYHSAPEEIALAVGLLDEGVDRIEDVSFVIFVQERPAWAVLPEGVPAFNEFPTRPPGSARNTATDAAVA